jgi:hypothetical protein
MGHQMNRAICRRIPARGIAAALLAGLLLAPALLAHATNTVVLFKTPSSANLFIGGNPLVVAEEVAPVGAPGLRSFDLEVTYNANILTVSAREGPFLSSTGNATSCTSSYVGAGDLQFSCVALGAPASGPTGRGILAYFDVLPQPSLDLRAAPNNGVLTLLHDLVGTSALNDVQGSSIPVASAGDALVVVRRLEGDLNKDCKVDVIDDQMIASRYPAVFGLLTYNLQFDLEPSSGDGDIDIKDLQVVFGRNGSTCEKPVPPQLLPPGETPTIPATATPTLTKTALAATHTPTAVSTTVHTATVLPASTSTRTVTATGNGTTTPSTPAPALTQTAGPAQTTTVGSNGTPTQFSTVLAVTSPSVPATKAPSGLPLTGLTGPLRALSSSPGWIVAGVVLSALGLALALTAATRRRRPR